jgi:hypothetical protein
METNGPSLRRRPFLLAVSIQSSALSQSSWQIAKRKLAANQRETREYIFVLIRVYSRNSRLPVFDPRSSAESVAMFFCLTADG